MANSETGIGFSVSADLHERFKAVADAEHRTFKGALINLMERRVAEHEASKREPVTTSGEA